MEIKLDKISDIDSADPDCSTCEGEGWVCDSHPNVAWYSGQGCPCGDCGAPCECNALFETV